MRVGILGQGASGVILAIMIKKKDPSIEVTIFDHNDKTNKKFLKVPSNITEFTFKLDDTSKKITKGEDGWTVS